MPVQVLDFSRFGNGMPVADFSNFGEGMKIGAMPKQIKQQQEQQRLQNALSQNQLNYAPQMSKAELGRMAAQNYLLGQQGQYYGQDMQSQMGLRNAQANLANQQASLPYGGHTLPGVAGDVLAIDSIKKLYGENSPQYERALNAFNLDQDAIRSRVGYQDVLAQTMPVRALTNTGKAIIEESNVGGGAMPTGQPWGSLQTQPMPQQQPPPQMMPAPQVTSDFPLPPQAGLPERLQRVMQPPSQTMPQQAPQQAPPMPNLPSAVQQNMTQLNPNAAKPPGSPEELASQYSLLRQKQATDVDTRKRNLFATNIEKTIGNIDVPSLTQYSGLKGSLEMKRQEALASVGKQSESYDKFQQSALAADFLASQVRQFYGESIQPDMRQKLEQLANPSTWTNNPKLAAKLFDQTKKILGQEMKTYRDALKTTKAFEGEGGSGEEAGAGGVRKFNPLTGKIE